MHYNDRPPITVCVATFNGSRFIKSQLKSILDQIYDHDQIIIVDDHSSDNTCDLLSSLSDSRFSIVRNNKNIGHVKSFERAIALAKNNYIFMSDQDDIWCDNRINLMLNELIFSNALLVSSNSILVDEYGFPTESIQFDGVISNLSTHHLKNIIHIFKGNTAYFGCQMCLHRDLLPFIIPFPRYVESHDLWIAMAANIAGRNRHLDYASLFRRIHGFNASIVKRPMHKKLFSRFIFFISFIHLLYRIKLRKYL